MAALPDSRHATVSAIWQAWEARAGTEPDRAYLGASEIGHSCERWLWLRFRWAVEQRWPGRMLRLFDRGQREEAAVVADLRSIGCQVWDVDGDGKQFRYTAVSGHFGGGMDGVVLGLPEAPKTAHLLEVKTHNGKSFAALSKHGVASHKPQHFMQMQVYMAMADLDRAVYVAVNKDNDEIHVERIERDRTNAERIFVRASQIIFADTPPLGVSESPEWWECKTCHAHALCHGTAAPRVNCRTCVHSTPVDDGAWHCAWHNSAIDIGTQRTGCPEHRHMPALLSRWAEAVDADEGANVIKFRNKLTGAEFDQPGYSSAEITACDDKACIGDKGVDVLKGECTAKIVAPQRPHDWTGLTDDLPWEVTA